MQACARSSESSTATVPRSLITEFSQIAHGRPARNLRMASPSTSSWSVSIFKRLFDLSIALPALALLSIPMFVIAVCVRLDSKGPALFIQSRVGCRGRLFQIYKFRSMTAEDKSGQGHTTDRNRRTTGLGRWLRKLKLDELPQLYNIVRGDMSLVGPRPKLPQDEAIADMPYRPGITGAASLAFRREEEILRGVHPGQLNAFYHQRIKPLKARIDVSYMCRATFWSDLQLIGTTFLACFAAAHVRPRLAQRPLSLGAMKPKPIVNARVSESFETAIAVEVG